MVMVKDIDWFILVILGHLVASKINFIRRKHLEMSYIGEEMPGIL